MTPCLDCGTPLGPVTHALSIHWCSVCQHRYTRVDGKLLTAKIDARLTPPDVLADAIQDRITPATGRLISATPIKGDA
mgnify:CR=1 FL=1